MLLYIDKLHISLVLLRHFIQQFKYPFCTCRGHNNRIHLLADLGNGLGKVLVKAHKCHDGSNGDPPNAVQGQQGTRHRTQHVT